MKILVITQKPGNHELADLVLQIPGHHVSLASSAEQAIGFLQSAHPGLILLDLRLPRRAGLRLVRRLRQNPRSRHIPALVVTGSPAFLNSKDFLSAGYEACFLGPFQSRTLTEQLMQSVAKAEPPRRNEMIFATATNHVNQSHERPYSR
jgi:two-component system phosphate regulon response regulator PhoB